MKAIHIRDIDERTLESLKRLAKRHHRSLQGELHYILEKAAELDKDDLISEELSLYTANSNSKSTWSREEIYDDSGR